MARTKGSVSHIATTMGKLHEILGNDAAAKVVVSRKWLEAAILNRHLGEASVSMPEMEGFNVNGNEGGDEQVPEMEID